MPGSGPTSLRANLKNISIEPTDDPADRAYQGGIEVELAISTMTISVSIHAGTTLDLLSQVNGHNARRTRRPVSTRHSRVL
jgi:hypothetical protein